jgi:hypothetical protein
VTDIQGFSRFDVRSGVVVIDPRDWEASPADFSLVEQVFDISPQLSRDAATELARRRRGLWVHEFVHFWQALSLPYLYVQAVYTWLLAREQWQVVADRRAAFDWRQEPVALGADPWAELSKRVRARAEPGGGVRLGIYQSLDEEFGVPALSPWQMMEGAASVFEYELFRQGERAPSAEDYLTWTLEHSAYLEVYDLVADVWGPEAAYELLPAVVAAAFHTINPVLVLVRLLDTLPPAAVEGLQRSGRKHALRSLLDALAATHEPVDFERDDALEPDEIRLLRPRELDAQRAHHPVLGPFRRRWLADDFARDSDALTLFLEFPAGEHEYQLTRWTRLVKDFCPPVICLAQRTQIGGNRYLRRFTPGPLDPGVIKTMLIHHAWFETMDVLAGVPSGAPHPCLNTTCRFHPTALCRGNFNPPLPVSDPERWCWFPDFLAQAGKSMSAPFVLEPA